MPFQSSIYSQTTKFNSRITLHSLFIYEPYFTESVKLRLTFKVSQGDSIICHTKISMNQMTFHLFQYIRNCKQFLAV